MTDGGSEEPKLGLIVALNPDGAAWFDSKDFSIIDGALWVSREGKPLFICAAGGWKWVEPNRPEPPKNPESSKSLRSIK